MQIPKQAKRVFKGVIFDVYQWKQKMFDGSYEIFEMLKRPDTVQIIATKGDNILIAEEEQPGSPKSDGLFGGRVDEGEQPLDAAKRELLEETGMESEEWELFKVYEYYFKIDWKLYYYIARNCGKIAEPKLENGEKINVKEVSLDEFFKMVLGDKFKGGEFRFDMLKKSLNDSKLVKFKKMLFGSIRKL